MKTNPLAPYHVTEPRVLRCYGTEYAQRTNGTTHLYNDQLNSDPQLAGGNLQTGAVSPASAQAFTSPADSSAAAWIVSSI